MNNKASEGQLPNGVTVTTHERVDDNEALQLLKDLDVDPNHVEAGSMQVRRRADGSAYLFEWKTVYLVKQANTITIHEGVKEKRAKVKEVFRSSKIGNIYGVVVTEGTINAADTFQGRPIESLRRDKDRVDSVTKGMECAIGLGDYADAQVGDVLIFDNGIGTGSA